MLEVDAFSAAYNRLSTTGRVTVGAPARPTGDYGPAGRRRDGADAPGPGRPLSSLLPRLALMAPGTRHGRPGRLGSDR